MKNKTDAPGLLATVLPGLSITKIIEQDKADIALKKAEYESALKRVRTYSSKENRDKIRQQKRRDEIIGRLFAARCEVNFADWIEFEPDLYQWLDSANDTDRVLFSLPPRKVEPPTGDTKEGSKAAAPPAKEEGKAAATVPGDKPSVEADKPESEGQDKALEAKDEPPVEPVHPDDPQGDS